MTVFKTDSRSSNAATSKGMHMRRLAKNLVLAALIAVGMSSLVHADEAVVGEGRAALGSGSAADIRAAAKRGAVRDALLKAIKDSTALDASPDQFAPIVNEIAKQLRSVKVLSEDSEGGDFVTRVEVYVDGTQLKNAIRGTDLDKSIDRSFSILMLVDEYSTTARNLNMPLKVLTEYHYDAGATLRDKSVKAASASASANTAVNSSGRLDAREASSTSIDASDQSQGALQLDHNSASGSERSSLKGSDSSDASIHAKQDYAASSAASASSASLNAKDIEAANHQNASYKSLVTYQDTSVPVSKPLFLSALSGHLRDYDLHLLDATNARSQFFGNQPVTLSTLTNSAQMTKFSDFVRSSVHADFILIGSATVIAGDRSPATGEIGCAVNAEVTAYATAGAEMIAAIAETTQSSGPDAEACAGTAATKVARMMAPEFAARVLAYWSDRAARGRQYTVVLKGTNVTLPMRIAFTKALAAVDGATAVETKEAGPSGVTATVTLKGSGDAMDRIYTAVSGQPAFTGKDLDGGTEGELVTLCLGKCPAPPKAGK